VARGVLPPCGKQYAVLPSAVAVDGTAVGTELERAQVTLYRAEVLTSLALLSLRLPFPRGDVDGFL
jgi:hypothetical protein